MSHTPFGYNVVPDIRDFPQPFDFRDCPLVSPQANVGSSLQNSQRGVSGARLGAGRFSRYFKLNGPDGSILCVTDLGERQKSPLNFLRKNVFVTGVHSAHPSFQSSTSIDV